MPANTSFKEQKTTDTSCYSCGYEDVSWRSYSSLLIPLKQTEDYTAVGMICSPLPRETDVNFHSCRHETVLPPSLLPGRSGELRTQKLKLSRTQSLNVLPLKPRVGLYKVIRAPLTAGDFFLANFYPSGPFICIFQNLSRGFFSFCNTGSCVGPHNKIVHTAGCRFPC